MFSLGIGLNINDFSNVSKQPKAFLVGTFIQMIVLPITAFAISITFNLSNEIAVGMMILACCPGGVTSNIITKLSNGNTALSISLTAIVSLATVITLPLIVSFSMNYFMGTSAPEINILSLGLTMFFITTIPVSFGVYLNSKYSPHLHTFKPLSNKISSVLFVLIVFGALSSEWNIFIENLSILAPSIFTLISIMLAIGYYIPKLLDIDNKKAKTIAIESSIQNATVGITIGNIILNSSTGISVFSLTSGVYGILMYIVSLPVIFLFLKNK
tara:strand:- start:20 stop:832 length:813 start_codon:yes stop_codon:yes gene_type:complete